MRGPITLAITGASGSAYALELLRRLLDADRQVYLMYSQAGQTVFKMETDGPNRDGSSDTDAPEEKLQVSVRGLRGKVLRPYVDVDHFKKGKGHTVSKIWSGFLVSVGASCLLDLQGLDLFATTLHAISDAGPDPLESLQPLEDPEKELFQFVLDIIWSSLFKKAAPLSRYLVDPDQGWSGVTLCVPVLTMVERASDVILTEA